MGKCRAVRFGILGIVAELVDARRVLELYPAGRVTQSRKLMQVRILPIPQLF